MSNKTKYRLNYRVHEEPDGSWRTSGTFPGLKGMIRGVGPSKEAAVKQMVEKAQGLFTIPGINFSLRELREDEAWP